VSCPTCSHTMAGLGYGNFHCARCGTVLSNGAIYVPALVSRCREFSKTITGSCALHAHEWSRLGIHEAINTPEHRQI
jgi:tRNA(Ile2) C34 agmatinyltransferase TiaS